MVRSVGGPLQAPGPASRNPRDIGENGPDDTPIGSRRATEDSDYLADRRILPDEPYPKACPPDNPTEPNPLAVISYRTEVSRKTVIGHPMWPMTSCDATSVRLQGGDDSASPPTCRPSRPRRSMDDPSVSEVSRSTTYCSADAVRWPEPAEPTSSYGERPTFSTKIQNLVESPVSMKRYGNSRPPCAGLSVVIPPRSRSGPGSRTSRPPVAGVAGGSPP
jgi:hypothetical protein